MGLGDLEREVMEVIWTSPASSFTVRDVGEYFPDHAYTTILTVLSRLSTKVSFKRRNKVDSIRSRRPPRERTTSRV